MIRFGTDGIRGRAGSPPIDDDTAWRVGAAAARLAWARGKGRVVIGYDTRPSSVRLADKVAEGCEDAGASAFEGGVIPTSAVMACAARPPFGAGVMVTASHNPAHDNGFKIVDEHGRKPDDVLARSLERWIEESVDEGQVGPLGTQARRGRWSSKARAVWWTALTEAVGDISPLKGRRIGIDLAHGAGIAARKALPAWLAQAGAEVVLLGEGDGVINDGVGSEHPEALSARIVAEGLDGGFAVDGDADRCVLVDEAGVVAPGDALAWLLARHLAAEAVAVTVMSSAALDGHLPGVRIVRTPVGDRHLAAAMKADSELVLGVEESGHVLFRDGMPGGDGLVTGLRCLVAAWSQGGALSEVLGGFTPFPRALTKVVVGRRPAIDEVPSLMEAVAEGEAQLGGGRVFLRYSGTEPVIRVLVEGPDQAAVDAVSAAVTEAARGALT